MTPAADILAAVSHAHRIPLHEMKGPSRYRPVVEARWDAMSQLRDMGLSYTVIGRLLNRTHAAVMHAVKQGAPYPTTSGDPS